MNYIRWQDKDLEWDIPPTPSLSHPWPLLLNYHHPVDFNHLQHPTGKGVSKCTRNLPHQLLLDQRMRRREGSPHSPYVPSRGAQTCHFTRVRTKGKSTKMSDLQEEARLPCQSSVQARITGRLIRCSPGPFPGALLRASGRRQ